MKFRKKTDEQKVKETKIFDNFSLARAIAIAVDQLDKTEASSDTLATAVAFVLEKTGYKKLEALTAGVEASIALHQTFVDLYWKNNSFTQRVTALTSVCATAEMLIREGNLDEKIKQTAEKQLAKQS